MRLWSTLALPASMANLLYVGRFHGRKNLLRLLDAFNAVQPQLAPEFKLVLVGGDQYHGYQVFDRIKELKLQDRVICPGYVAKEDLPIIYRQARCFVYPSLFEGFGLPPLEAMASGTPVITSNNSSLGEIAGDAAVLVDPYDTDSIRHGLVNVLLDEDMQASLREKGLQHAKKFSWAKAAEETNKVYELVANAELDSKPSLRGINK
jgi:glycosyltransferase involved in cell wall biosynthesis